ncbi:MAG: alpha-amylase/4-alpha-glucanotransferase domain-containing protein [Candidatus Thorarchaeota archaeon]
MLSPKHGIVYFPIVWHAHQPVGNFSWIIEDAYKKAYLPLIQTLSRYPSIKSNIHFSGPLLIWLQKNHPEYLEQICTLYHNKQIEIIGGGFYEPILAVIPDRDKEKQIQLMLDWWEENYKISPVGIWLAERVWVPGLPPVLRKMGANFTFIDDYLFYMAGLSEQQTFYTYMTEDQGIPITIFPINQRIRYLVPWSKPEETIQYLMKGCDEQNEKIIVMISDMEKMGVWPAGDRTTHDICYVDGYNGTPWMNNFFEEIIQNSWIRPILISEYLQKNHPRGLLYLPTSSYDKMAVWALPSPLRRRLEKLFTEINQDKMEPRLADDIRTFAKGTIWQNFLIKYSQSNVMHKRMLFCRAKIELTEKSIPTSSPDLFAKIWENLLISQSNDSYWHGFFGGIYYRFLRHSTHKHIIFAEYYLDKLRRKLGLEEFVGGIQDVLLDGEPDGILENENLSCFISSMYGGSIFALNLKKIGYNFLNTLTRQNESYHTNEVKNVQDRFEKWSFQDHFLRTKISEDSLQKDTYKDLGNFANQTYEIIQNPDQSITLARSGVILHENRVYAHIAKKYQLKNSTLFIDYTIDFSDNVQPNSLLFSPEINVVGASHPHETFGIINNSSFSLETTFSCSRCQTVEIRDLNEGASLLLHFNKPVESVIFPLFSIFKSEIGIEKIYQGTSIFPKIKISGKKLRFALKMLLKSIKRENFE